MKSRKSHCGINATNLQRVGRCEKSAIVTGSPATCAVRLRASWCGRREERFEDAELVEQLERRRMDGVAAKVAEEVGVLFENGDVHAGTRQE